MQLSFSFLLAFVCDKLYITSTEHKKGRNMAVVLSIRDQANRIIEEIQDVRVAQGKIKDSKSRIIEEAVLALAKKEKEV